LNGCIHAVSGIDPAAQECIKTAEREGDFYRRERKERKEGGETPLSNERLHFTLCPGLTLPHSSWETNCQSRQNTGKRRNQVRKGSVSSGSALRFTEFAQLGI